MTAPNYVELLSRSASTPNAALTSYLVKYNPAEPALHMFVEGRGDEGFYPAVAFRILGSGSSINLYRCGNRDGVLKVFTEVKSRFARPVGTMFFIDKDWSDYLRVRDPRSVHLFKTPTYSFENLMISGHGLQRLWNEYLHCSDAGAGAWEAIKRAFDKAFASFTKVLEPVCALGIAIKATGFAIDWSGFKLGRVFDLDDELSLEIKLSGDALLDHVCSTLRVTPSQRDRIRARRNLTNLQKRPYKSWLRGKWELWFFNQFVNAVRKLVMDCREENDGVPRPGPEISEDTAVAILSEKCALNSKLTSFVKTRSPATK